MRLATIKEPKESAPSLATQFSNASGFLVDHLDSGCSQRSRLGCLLKGTYLLLAETTYDCSPSPKVIGAFSTTVEPWHHQRMSARSLMSNSR
jgi:hypothetical protein